MGLAQRFVVGSAFMGAGQLFSNAANLAMQVVIARLLGPAEFGVYAFCFAVNEFINILGAFSLSYALIHAEEARQEDLDTAFAISLALGVLGIVIAVSLAPWVGAQRSMQAVGILLLMALMRTMRLLAQVPEAVLERSLRFRAVTATSALSSVLPNVVAVLLASLGFGAWSLGIRDAAVGGLLLGIAWFLSGYRFQAQISRDAWKKLMDYARPMFASRGIEIVMERLDSLAVATLFGNRAAGLYHQARFLSEAGFVATKPFERMAFNLYARVRDDRVRLARGWALTNYFLLRVMLAGASALLLFPEEVVLLLLGEEWLDVAPVLRWLALYAALFPIFHNAKNLCYGLGEVRRMVRVRLVQAIVFVVAVAFASFKGSLEAMAAGLLATTAFALAYAWWQTLDLVESPPIMQLVLPFVALAMTLIVIPYTMDVLVLDEIPLFARPLIAPLVMVLCFLVLEPRRLPAEIHYLWRQLHDDS